MTSSEHLHGRLSEPAADLCCGSVLCVMKAHEVSVRSERLISLTEVKCSLIDLWLHCYLYQTPPPECPQGGAAGPDNTETNRNHLVCLYDPFNS